MDHLLRNKSLSNTDNIISSIKREHESSDDDNFEENVPSHNDLRVKRSIRRIIRSNFAIKNYQFIFAF